jgi:ABC-type antimicrobial peptide transport system permease subunit
VLVNLIKRDTGRPTNVMVRGVGAGGPALRPQVKIIEGRMFRPGASEIVAGLNAAERFKGAGIGEVLWFGQREWRVVGVFDAGKSGFDSEIWGDADQLMQAFRRPVYSAVLVKLSDSGRFDEFKSAVEGDQRLTVEAKRETVFYADQSEVLANFIKYLGLTLSIIFSIGAVIGAMITMYASVASRTAEIGTLRALGFRRRSVLAAFLLEAALLGLAGGCAGLFFASFMQLFTISTMNWQSFSELAFSFTLTPAIAVKTLVFALAMGIFGGFLPAIRASRLNIVDALRST